MDPLQFNIKHIRHEKGMTQEEFATELGIKRSRLGAYEEGRSRPKLSIQQHIAHLGGITLEQLVTKELGSFDLQVNDEKPGVNKQPIGPNGEHQIAWVSIQAETSYLKRCHEGNFQKELPHFQLPFLENALYRAFEAKDNAMPPLGMGSTIIGQYVSDLDSIEDGQPYVVVSSTHGIMYRRVFTKTFAKDQLILQPDEPTCIAFFIDFKDILEVWQAKLHISPIGLSANNNQPVQKLRAEMHELQQEVMRLRQKVDGEMK